MLTARLLSEKACELEIDGHYEGVVYDEKGLTIEWIEKSAIQSFRLRGESGHFYIWISDFVDIRECAE